jgi:hypothetical protein
MPLSDAVATIRHRIDQEHVVININDPIVVALPSLDNAGLVDVLRQREPQRVHEGLAHWKYLRTFLEGVQRTWLTTSMPTTVRLSSIS